jgi:hypothetical protein
MRHNEPVTADALALIRTVEVLHQPTGDPGRSSSRKKPPASLDYRNISSSALTQLGRTGTLSRVRELSDAYRYWRWRKFPTGGTSPVLADLKGDLALRDAEIGPMAISIFENGLSPAWDEWPVIDLLADVDRIVFALEDFEPETAIYETQRKDLLDYANALRQVYVECLAFRTP